MPSRRKSRFTMKGIYDLRYMIYESRFKVAHNSPSPPRPWAAKARIPRHWRRPCPPWPQASHAPEIHHRRANHPGLFDFICKHHCGAYVISTGLEKAIRLLRVAVCKNPVNGRTMTQKSKQNF
jgi:hypothetical protein